MSPRGAHTGPGCVGARSVLHISSCSGHIAKNQRGFLCGFKTAQKIFREAKSISSLSLARYQGSTLDRRSAEEAASIFGGRVDSVSYPGEGHVIFNVTINLGIDVADARSNIVAVPPIAEGRWRGISRLDSIALSSLIWLHSKAPECVSRFLTQSRPGSHHASDLFVRVLGDRKAMYRRAYANILGYMEGAARRQRLASLSIVTCDRPPASTRDKRETEARKSVIIRSAQVQRASCLIWLSWISGVATIVLSSIYREELGTDIPAIVIAVITLNFIIATQAVVAQMTPEHNVFEVLRAKLTITPTRRSALILYDEDAEDYLEMVVKKKRPEVLKRQGACFLRGSCDTGNVKLDGVRMNVMIPGLNRYITRDWIPIVAFAERTENVNEDQGTLAGSAEQGTMLDFTTSSTSVLHFLPAGNKRDTTLTGLMWNSPVKAGGLEMSGLRWNVSSSTDEGGSTELHRRVQRPTGWPTEDFRGAELEGVWFTNDLHGE